jgi:hypothetical protein
VRRVLEPRDVEDERQIPARVIAADRREVTVSALAERRTIVRRDEHGLATRRGAERGAEGR